MKRKKRRLDGAFLRALDLPEESGGRIPRVTLVGCTFVMAENHRGIYRCGADRVLLMTEEGLLTVSGTELTLKELSVDRLCVLGNITGIEYDNKVKRVPLLQ